VHAEPQVETPGTRAGAGQAGIAPRTDPVCGMTVDPGTAPARRGTGPDAAYFCSAGCAAAFDADPGRYAVPGTSLPPLHASPESVAGQHT